MRALVLTFPEFVTDVERQWAGVSDTRPLVVGGRADSPGRVGAACRLARAAGVRVGMPLEQAGALVPEALFVPGVLDRYAEAASMVDEVVRGVCGAVAWTAIDEAVVTDGARPTGARPLSSVADAVRAAVRGRLPMSVAVGLADSEVAARVAARLAAPAGLVEVLPGYAARFMAPLDIAWLPDLPATVAQRLRAHGIDTIGALAIASPDAIRGVAGARATGWQLAAAGVDATCAVATRVPRSLTRAQWTRDALTLSDIADAVEAAAEAVTERLCALGLHAQTVTVRVLGRDDRFRSRSVTLPEAVSERVALGPVARALAARLWRYGDVPRRVSVVASGLTADGPQLTLFGPAPSGDGPRAIRTPLGFRALARRRRRAG
jgi:DNA polymerase IV